MPLPTNAVKLDNGDISIADQFNNRAFIINPHKMNEFQYGMTGVSGSGFNQLFGPYTALRLATTQVRLRHPTTFNTR